MGNDGVKYDEGKLRYDLIPPIPLQELARVFTIGAVKYGDENWRKGMKWKRIFGAIMRHAWAWMRGERLDHESGIHHLAHAAWGCLVLIEYEICSTGEDDRYKYKRGE